MDGFSRWAESHPKEFRKLNRQAIAGAFDIDEGLMTDLIIEGHEYRVRVLTPLYSDLSFRIRRLNLDGDLEENFVRVKDPNRDILEVEIMSDHRWYKARMLGV